MISYPIFPTSSLYGSFPPFPSYTYGWSYTLPVWPYSTFGFSVRIPNLAGIPAWFAQIILWGLGWGAAIFLYALQMLVALVVNTALAVINYLGNLITSVLKTTLTYLAPLGIWAIPLESAIAGLMAITIILGFFGIIKGLQKLGETAA